MIKPISTRTHGVLDYLSVGALCAIPRMLGWDRRVTTLLTGAAAGTLLYSALTRYELGLVKLLPMPAHLALDGASGVLLCAAPFLFLDEKPPPAAGLVGIGLFELGASLLTQTSPAQG